MGKPALLVVVVVAMVGAAVALAFAGLEPAAIVGLLAGLAAIVTPMLALAFKTDAVHTMVNQQRTDMMSQLELQRAALQAAGVTLPPDPSLKPPPSPR